MLNCPFPENLLLHQTLQALVAEQQPAKVTQPQLEELVLADELRSTAFGITSETVEPAVQRRSHLFQSLYPALNQFCQDSLRQHCPPEIIWNLWLPLALWMEECHQRLKQPLIQGILGGQGTGKTTLAAVLTLILSHLGYQVCSLSLDDLYKTYAERLQLQQTDPRFRWRGPPGTHDIELGLTVLQQFRCAAPHPPVQIPQFDKSAWNGAGDRTAPKVISGADMILFEGWFVGVRPIAPAVFDTAPPPIITTADRAFARDVNTKLQDYLPLWQQLDRLIVLHPTDYRLSQQWRRQAEQQRIASGQSGMTEGEIDQFVEYFWRSLHPQLFISPLLQDPEHVDLVIEINPDHTPGKVYKPLE